jgi:translation elongation factor EF-G
MRHLQKSGIITLKALGGPIGSRTVQVQEQQLEETKFIAFFMGKKIDIEGKDLYDAKQKAITQLKVPKSKVGLLAVVSAESQKNQDFKFEYVTEGKKAFKVNPGIGKAKYSISSHDGVKKHKDGSDFWDIEIFKNKVDLEKAIKNYSSKGFVKEDIENVANGLPQTMGKQKSLKREALKSIVREVMQEEAEYQKFFQKVLDKAGKSIPSMSDDEKKAFFNKVDAAWKAKQERD